MKNADKPAYPLPKDRDIDSINKNGLTKREIFAIAAMQGILAKESWLERLASEQSENGMIQKVVKASIRISDELLKQLEQSNQKEQ